MSYHPHCGAKVRRFFEIPKQFDGLTKI